MAEKKIIVPEKKLITNASLADRAVAFISALKHTKGEWHGKNFELLPWQEKVVRDVFGTVKANGYRQYNTAYIEIPKKQGKSELAAAVALYLLAGDGEWGAEVYGCAADRQQASIVFDVACQMVEQCPALKKRIKPVLSQKRLVYTPLNSFYQVLSAESYTKHGLNVHGVVFDELHAQPNRLLYDVMTHGSGDARKQPLFFLITTAGTDRNSICWEVHQKAQDILAGRKIDPTFYPVIYGIPDDADWSDEKNWYLANPSLDVTVDIDKLRAAYQSAKDNPAEENLFRQLRLNQWVKQSVGSRGAHRTRMLCRSRPFEQHRHHGVCSHISAQRRRRKIHRPPVLLGAGRYGRAARQTRPRPLRCVGEARQRYDDRRQRYPLRIH